MSIKHYCDFCGKETFHMDLGSTKDGKEICPQCMEIRCKDMAKVILNVDFKRMAPGHVGYLHSTFSEIIFVLDLSRELRDIQKGE